MSCNLEWFAVQPSKDEERRYSGMIFAARMGFDSRGLGRFEKRLGLYVAVILC